MNNKRTATVRTTVNSTALMVLASIASRLFGWNVDLANPAVVVVLGVITPIFYRASVALSEKWPVLGYVLFGKNATVSYKGK